MVSCTLDHPSIRGSDLVLSVWRSCCLRSGKDSGRFGARLWIPVDLDVHPRIAAAFPMAWRPGGTGGAGSAKKAIPWTGLSILVLILLAIGILVSTVLQLERFFRQQSCPDCVSFFRTL